jgi:hypothetical protein
MRNKLNNLVKIKPLKLEGRVKEIYITRAGDMFLIRYLYEMQMLKLITDMITAR